MLYFKIIVEEYFSYTQLYLCYDKCQIHVDVYKRTVINQVQQWSYPATVLDTL